MRRIYRLSASCLAVLVSTEVANADSVSDSLEHAMRECVAINAATIGSPVADIKLWSEVVAAATALSYSNVTIMSLNDGKIYPDAIKERTGEILISILEEKGFKDFRGQVLKTLDFCIPSAVSAAALELRRQQTSPCPDDTDYRNAVNKIKSSDHELKEKYGDSPADLRSDAILSVDLSLLVAFPEIFSYRKEADYPEFSGTEYALLDSALTKISISGIKESRVAIDEALSSIGMIEGSKPERVSVLQRKLTCIKDWLDIYPSEEISNLRGQ